MGEDESKLNPLPWWPKPGSVAAQLMRLARIAVIFLGGLLCLAALVIFVRVLADLDSALSKPEHEDAASVRDLFAPLIALVGFPFLIWRAVIADRQSQASKKQAALAEDRNFSDLFTKAVEQLGADKVVKRHAKDRDGKDAYDKETGVPVMEEVTEPNIEVRLGAIYALQRISRASEKDHIPVMETLCAYIRENAVGGKPDEFPLGELPERGENEPLENYLTLVETRARNLHDFFSPDFFSPEMTLRSDVRAALTAIQQRDARCRAIEKKAGGFRLDFRSANLQRVNLIQFDFANADFSAAYLEGAYLLRAEMERACIRFAKIDGAALVQARMESADLSHATMEGAILSQATMVGADLSHAKMVGVNLREARMEAADLFDAKLEGANLCGARLEMANLSGARLEGAEGLEQATLDRFFGCAGTKLPDGLTHPDHWHPTPLENWKEAKAAYETWVAKRKAAGLPPFEKA